MRNPRTDRDPSQELSPRAARSKFLTAKRANVKPSTVRAYEYPTKHFVEYCEANGIDVIGDVNNYLVESWVQKREAEDISAITVKNTVKFVRVFFKWCTNSGLLEPGIYDRTRVPAATEAETVSSEVVRTHIAEQILEYLSTYNYATRQHTLFAFMWETACRASGAIAIDVDDLGTDSNGNPAVWFKDRSETGTPLKNSEKSERKVMLTDDLMNLIDDYREINRPRFTDKHGRNPLFCTKNRRLQRQRAYKDTTAFTRPCVYSGRCPIDKDIETCEYRPKKKAMSCPESTSLHPIRRGSITKHINRGWNKEMLSERVDVSVSVLEKHYDARTEEDALQRREQYRDML